MTKNSRTKNARIYGEQNPGANPMAQVEFGAETDVNHVKQQNAQVEFGAETDVNHVKQQNQQAQAGKTKASGPYANRFGNSTK